MGVIPPLSHADWMEVFEKYKQYPEYQKINAGMSLEAFKSIFYWEYGHRVLGRLIGMIYFIPLVWFLFKGVVPREWKPRLFGLFILGGMQGLMGWYMVKSGLVDVPHVSQYRLTAHLSLALVIYGCMIWFAMDFLRGQKAHNRASDRYKTTTLIAVALVFIMMMSGGFVAGTKAGFIYNTFPKMGDEWIASGVMAMEPVWKNIFENPATIQLIHRWLALLVVVTLVWSLLASRVQPFSTAQSWVMAALALQVALGISALVLRVPVWLGALHQAGAVALFTAVLFAAHKARKEA